LSATQLDASSNGIAGTITYSEAVGTVLKAGTYNLSALFVPTSSDYSIETAEVLLTVNPAPAPVTWTQPADIANGAALSATQLDATSTIPGTFVYSPGLGTVLTLGPHLLSATFTPTDTIDYKPTTVSVAITVSQGSTTYDKGTVSFVANTTTLATVSYGQSSTPATIASALATAVNSASGTPVKLTAVDEALFITAVTPGAAGDSITYSISNVTFDLTDFSGPSFPSAPISGSLEGGAALGTDAGKPVYSYSDGYDHAGNMLASNDLVMGNWTFTPDTLNRLASATNLPPSSTSTSYYCWSYDGFGNRTLQGVSSAAFATGPPACTPQTGASYAGVWAHVSTANNNQLSNTQKAMGGVAYDGAGNILNDGVNQYLYDAKGRICAVATESLPGSPQLSGYIYNAQGQRIAKGSITAWSCDPTVNGFKPMSDYVLGLSAEQVTEMGMDASGVMAWQHTNAYALGQLIATYDNDGLHFYLNDPLGTRRAQTDYAGVLEQTCASLPFGDALNCTNSLQFPTEHHFTGKERDAESGNDYFGARYYASSMGRFLSPDWSSRPAAAPYADFGNPQTLNLYQYMRNNPLSGTDPDGHWPCCLILPPTPQQVANMARNVGIGLVKAGVNALNSIQSDHALPASAQAPILQPSNATQAVTMMAAPMVVAPAMTITVSAMAPAAIETESVSVTTLFRAVDSTEAQSISDTGQFLPSPNGTEYKGFFNTAEGAQNFSAAQSAAGGPETTVVSGAAPTGLVNSSPVHSAATEGPGVLIHNDNLPQVKPQ
jgi:RHS repeat-associated protein